MCTCSAHEPNLPRSTAYTISRATPIHTAALRPRALGKFFYVGDRKLYLRGVTYGTFRPDAEGNQYGPPDQVEQDFGMMARNGINAVRLYTVPPRWLLDLADPHGLYVMVGIPWEQHIAFLDSRQRRAGIEQKVREGVRACAGHPAVLCYCYRQRDPRIARALVRAQAGRAIPAQALPGRKAGRPRVALSPT